MPVPKQVDVVILGGGIAALGAGCALVRRGKKVLFVSPAQPLGGEATPASAGILDPFLESERLSQPFFRLKKAAFLDFKNQIRNLEAETKTPTGFLACGMLFTARSAVEERELKQRLALHRPSGIPVRWLNAAQCRKKWPALNPSLRGVLFYPTLARVLPSRLQKALFRFVCKKGAAWIDASGPVKVVARQGRVLGIRLGKKMIPARFVINASGSWAGRKTAAPFSLPVVPVRGQVLIVQGKGPALRTIAHSARGIYVVPWEKKRYLLGSTVERAGFRAIPQPRTLKRIRCEAAKIVPGLAGMKTFKAWAGLRPCSRDRLPLIGETALKGYYAAAGYYRSGIVIGMHAGELLVRGMLSGRMPPALKPFSPMRRFPVKLKT